MDPRDARWIRRLGRPGELIDGAICGTNVTAMMAVVAPLVSQDAIHEAAGGYRIYVHCAGLANATLQALLAPPRAMAQEER
jgi:hypothetical protein